MTLKAAKEAFEQAQEIALHNTDELGELMATGMLELTNALQVDMRKLISKLDDLERRVKRLD